MSKRSLTLSSSEIALVAADILERGSTVRLRAYGTSMLPTLRSGDLVTLAPVDASSLLAGDIVLLRGSRCRIHRVTRVDHAEGTLKTRGDARNSDDPPHALADVLGRVVQVDQSWWTRTLGFAREVGSQLRKSMVSSKKADSNRQGAS